MAVAVNAQPAGLSRWWQSLVESRAQAQQPPGRGLGTARRAERDEESPDADELDRDSPDRERPGDVPTAPERIEMPGAEVVARVGGTEIVLRADVDAIVDAKIEELIAANGGAEPSERQLEMLREQLNRQALASIVETKLLLVSARARHNEQVAAILEKFGQQFDDVEVPKLLKRAKARNVGQLDRLLRRQNTSLDRERRKFCEQSLSRGWVAQVIKVDKDVTHQEMLDYYRERIKDFTHPAKARWEHLKVRYSDVRSPQDPLRAKSRELFGANESHVPSRDEALDRLAELGNRVLDGAPIEELATDHSDCTICRGKGGRHDWTSPKTLKARQLDEALFTLPVGDLSPILDDGSALHIVRVVERREAGATPFEELQPEIRKKIQDARVGREVQKYIGDLRKHVPAWTIYDDQGGLFPETADRPAGRRR